MAAPPPVQAPATAAMTGTRQTLERAEDLVHEALVSKGVLRAGEVPELGDIGAGGEGLLTGAGNDENLDPFVRLDPSAQVDEALIHREGQGVSCLWPVEDDAGDAGIVGFEQDLVGGAHAGFPCRTGRSSASSTQVLPIRAALGNRRETGQAAFDALGSDQNSAGTNISCGTGWRA